MKAEEIKQAYENFKTAVISRDLRALKNIYADDFFWTNFMGITNNKAENLERVNSGNLSYLSWVNEETSVRIYGDIAILLSKEILKMKIFGQHTNTKHRIIAIFRWQGDQWLLTGGQSTQLD